jgi:limonene-1,2-epoxide hydrolase
MANAFAAQSPDQLVRAFMDAVAVKDFDVAMPYIAEHCDYWNVPLSRVTGPAAVRAVLEPFFAPTLENEFRILRHATAGPVHFTERLDRHRLDTGWVELPVTGVFEVTDGRISRWHDYFDLGTLLKAWPALASALG